MPLETPIRILLTAEERAKLESIARGLALPYRAVVRATIVLALADGATVSATAARLGTRHRMIRIMSGSCRNRERGSSRSAWTGSPTIRTAAGRRVVPPVVATHRVKLACELPDEVGSPLAL